jgi:hypothetical protein
VQSKISFFKGISEISPANYRIQGLRIPSNLITQSGNVISQSDYSAQSTALSALLTYCGEANTQPRIPQSIPPSQTNL